MYIVFIRKSPKSNARIMDVLPTFAVNDDYIENLKKSTNSKHEIIIYHATPDNAISFRGEKID